MRTLMTAASLILATIVGGCYFSDAVPPDLSLRTHGSALVTLPGLATFQAQPRGIVECRSDQARRIAEEVIALEVGELQSGTLRAFVHPFSDASPTGSVEVELLIDGADLPPGAPQPDWLASASVTQLASDGTSGTASFEAALQSVPDDAADKVSPNAGVIPTGWPTTLQGEISWACDPWPDPNQASE